MYAWNGEESSSTIVFIPILVVEMYVVSVVCCVSSLGLDLHTPADRK